MIAEEKRILDDLVAFQEDSIDPASIETEQFYFHYNSFYQPRIYNDIITLKVLHSSQSRTQPILCLKLRFLMRSLSQ
jgi:uncharacterized Rmd1/YagE family protein